MTPTLLLSFCAAVFLIGKDVHGMDSSSFCPYGSLQNWKKGEFVILQPTEKKPSRTAVLIIAPPHINENDPVQCRWQLGKKVWEQYMNIVPGVDCYFVQCANRRKDSEDVWCNGNTIYVGDSWYEDFGMDRILHKTILAIEYLQPKYTHFIRTNLNSFFNLKAVLEYTETHHQSMYTGPLWQREWYVLGYGILFSADVAAHIVSEYRKLEGSDAVSLHHPDDCVLTSLATGIYPLDSSEHVFCKTSTLPLGIRQLMSYRSFSDKRLSPYGTFLTPPISLRQAFGYCERSPDSVILYRIREGFTLAELAQLYQYLLNKIYPGTPVVDLREHVRTFPSI